MKRLLTVFAVAVAVLTASAKVTDTQDFETANFEVTEFFTLSMENEDSSTQVEGSSIAVPLGGTASGNYYLSLDTGDATLWRTNELEAAYFDMAVKFTPTAVGDEPTPGAEDKILVYMNADTNIVVISGTAANDTTPVTNTVTTAGIEANEWARLSISAKDDRFFVYVNGTSLNDTTGYYSLASGTTVKEVGFSGCGALDNFVARTTDPFLTTANAVASIGEENYSTLEQAVAEASAGDTILLRDDVTDSSVSVVLQAANVVFDTNGNTFNGSVSAASGFGWTENNGVYTSDNNTASTWVGAVAGADWTVANNWSNHAVPTATTDVTIPAAASGCTIYVGGNDAKAKSLAINGNVTLVKDSSASGYGVVTLSSNVTGSATLTLNRTGLKGATATQKTTIGCPLAFYSTATTTVDGDKESYLMTGSFVVNGALTGVGRLRFYDNVTLNGDVTLTGDSWAQLRFAKDATINGTVVLGSKAFFYFDKSPATFGNDADLEGAGLMIVCGNNLPGAKLSTLLGDQNKWTGTYELRGATITSVWWLGKCGNALSKVRMNNVTTYLNNSNYSGGSHNVKLEVADKTTFTINGSYSHNSNWVFPNELTGSGTICIDTANGATPGNKTFAFTGDCSGFSGSLAFGPNSANTRFLFGTTQRGVVEKTIVVGADAVGVKCGGTWTAENGIFVDGELALSSKAAMLDGTVFGSGTVVADYVPAAADNSDYISVPFFGNDVTNTFAVKGMTKGYFRDMAGNDFGHPAVNATLRLDGDVTISNGDSSDVEWTDKITTFKRIAGTRNLTITASPYSSYVNYGISQIDGGYSGTITINSAKARVTIDAVDFAADPVVGASCAKPIEITAGSVRNAGGTTLVDGTEVALTVNGVARTDGLALYYKEPVSGTKGLYFSGASVTIDDTTRYYADAAAAAAAVAEAEADVPINVLDGSTPSVSGWYYDSATSQLRKTKVVVVNASTLAETSYGALSDAIAASGEGDTVKLCAASVEIAVDTTGKDFVFDENGFEFSGTLTGSGTIRVVTAPSSTTWTAARFVPAGWTGTFVMGWTVETQDDNTSWILDNYGISGSTVEVVNAITAGYFKAAGSGMYPSVAPAVYFDNNVTLNNGYQGSSSVTTFAKVGMASGKTFTTRGRNNGDATYFTFTVLEGFEGSIVIRGNDHVRIGTIVVEDELPSAGQPVVPVSKVAVGSYANGTIDGLGSVKVQVGSATPVDMPMAFATLNDVSGLYKAVAQVGADGYYATLADAVAAANAADVTTITRLDSAAGEAPAGWTLTGDTYSLDTYTVTYNLDLEGATNAVDNIASYTINTPEFTLLDAGCEGYKFNNWTNSSGEVVETISSGSTGDVTLYASWTLDEPETPTIPEVSPGTNTVYDCGTADNAAAVAAAMNNPETRADYIKAPAAAGITDGTSAASTYASYFSARVDGTSVVLELNEAGTNALETASTNVAANVAVQLSTIATTANATTATVGGAQPGFYYRVVYDDSISGLGTETSVLGDAGLANAAGQVTLNIPAKKNGATAGFYRIVVDTAPSSGN